jgi:ribosome-binding factor A
MTKKRVERLNSLLKEVISEVVMKDVRNPHVAHLITITNVEISNDIKYAKVFISVIGSDKEKQESLDALQSAAGFIAVHASKKVRLRYFPELTFRLDNSVDKHLKIDEILSQIHEEQKTRKIGTDGSNT